MYGIGAPLFDQILQDTSSRQGIVLRDTIVILLVHLFPGTDRSLVDIEACSFTNTHRPLTLVLLAMLRVNRAVEALRLVVRDVWQRSH